MPSTAWPKKVYLKKKKTCAIIHRKKDWEGKKEGVGNPSWSDLFSFPSWEVQLVFSTSVWIILCHGDETPLYCRVFSSIPGLYSRYGEHFSPHTPSWNKQKCLQALPNIPGGRVARYNIGYPCILEYLINNDKFQNASEILHDISLF